jgi:hypothetical protein
LVDTDELIDHTANKLNVFLLNAETVKFPCQLSQQGARAFSTRRAQSALEITGRKNSQQLPMAKCSVSAGWPAEKKV